MIKSCDFKELVCLNLWNVRRFKEKKLHFFFECDRLLDKSLFFIRNNDISPSNDIGGCKKQSTDWCHWCVSLSMIHGEEGNSYSTNLQGNGRQPPLKTAPPLFFLVSANKKRGWPFLRGGPFSIPLDQYVNRPKMSIRTNQMQRTTCNLWESQNRAKRGFEILKAFGSLIGMVGN